MACEYNGCLLQRHVVYEFNGCLFHGHVVYWYYNSFVCGNFVSKYYDCLVHGQVGFTLDVGIKSSNLNNSIQECEQCMSYKPGKADFRW